MAPAAAKRAELADALDHPIFFLFVVTLGVLGFAALLTWGAKAANLPGLAALAQHP